MPVATFIIPMIFLYGCFVAIFIYVLLLITRLVKAVERIADRMESR